MPPPGQSDISQPKTLSQGNVKASSNESFFGGKKRKIFPSTSGFEPARSKVMRGSESSHMTSYQLLIETTWLGSTVLKIQLFENTLTLICPFKVTQGQRLLGEMKAHI